MTGAMPLPGINYLVVTVQSVDGNQAWVRSDQAGGRTFMVRRDLQRAKGDLPEPGEQWIIDRPYGVDAWIFSLLLTASNTPAPRPAVMVVADRAGRDAITAPTVGQMAFRSDTRLLDVFDGTIWRGTQRAATAETLTWDTVARFTPTVHATIAIADPGWPYRLRIYGQVRVSVGTSTSINIYVTSDGTLNGPQLTRPASVPTGDAANNFSRMRSISGMSGELTGSRTLGIAIGKLAGTGGDGWQVYDDDTGASKIYADVMPST